MNQIANGKIEAIRVVAASAYRFTQRPMLFYNHLFPEDFKFILEYTLSE
jgi:hypothetical protein